MDAKELIRVAVAGKGEQAGWNSLGAQYQPMMREIARMRCPNDRVRPIARRRSLLPFDWYGRSEIEQRINTEARRRPTTVETVAMRTGFEQSGGIRS